MGFLEMIGVVTLVSAGVGIACGVIEGTAPPSLILPIYRTLLGLTVFWLTVFLIEKCRDAVKGSISEEKPLE